MKNISIFLCCFFSFTLGLGVMYLCTYTKKDPLTRIRESMITNKIDVDAALCRYLRENKDLMDDIQKKKLFLDVMRTLFIALTYIGGTFMLIALLTVTK